MKKILITLLILFSFIVSFAQDISVAKSSLMSFGKKNDYAGEFKFNPFEEIDEVYIIVEENKLSVNSKVQQFYYIDSAAIPLEDVKGNYWYAEDINGIRCRVYLYMDSSSDIFFAVEYNDYSWIYNIKPVE